MTMAEQSVEFVVPVSEYEQTSRDMDWLEPTVMQTPLGSKLLAGSSFMEHCPYESPTVDGTLLLGDMRQGEKVPNGYQASPMGTRAFAVSPGEMADGLVPSRAVVSEVVTADDETVGRLASLLPQLSKRYFIDRDPEAGLRSDTFERIGRSVEAAVADQATHILVARDPDSNAITATLTFVELPNNCLMIEDVVVDSRFRGSQGCRELDGMLQYVAEFGTEHNSSAVVLTTEPNRPDAVRAYEKRGFQMLENTAVYTPAPEVVERTHAG